MRFSALNITRLRSRAEKDHIVGSDMLGLIKMRRMTNTDAPRTHKILQSLLFRSLNFRMVSTPRAFRSIAVLHASIAGLRMLLAATAVPSTVEGTHP